MEKRFRVFCMGLLWGMGIPAMCNQFFDTHFTSADKIAFGLMLAAAFVLIDPWVSEIDIAIRERNRPSHDPH